MTSRTRRLLLFAIFGVVVFWAHYKYVPIGVDYFLTFSPAVVSWQNGQAVFTPPYYGFFNAPWLLFLLLPLEWLTQKGAEAALVLITVAGIIRGWHIFTREYRGYILPISLAICLMNLHTYDLLQRGQIDIFVLFSALSIYIGIERNNPYLVGTGWVLAGVRPTSICLVVVYSAWLAYKHRHLIRTMIIPIVTLVLSFLIFGPDWIGRWITMFRDSPPQPTSWMVTWWRAATYLGLSPIYPTILAISILIITFYIVYRYRPELKLLFAFLIAASLCVVPYELSYHYIVLLVVCVPVLLNWQLWLAIPVYGLTLTPLIRLIYGADIAWIDILLPLSVWLLLIIQIVRAKYAPSHINNLVAAPTV